MPEKKVELFNNEEDKTMVTLKDCLDAKITKPQGVVQGSCIYDMTCDKIFMTMVNVVDYLKLAHDTFEAMITNYRVEMNTFKNVCKLVNNDTLANAIIAGHAITLSRYHDAFSLYALFKYYEGIMFTLKFCMDVLHHMDNSMRNKS